MMMTVDEVLKMVSDGDPISKDVALDYFFYVAYECIRLRDEVNGLTGSLERAESVLQNLMSYLSVNGCRTEIDPENAELRIRDGINMLVQPVLERAELAEKALKEAQEQEPVAWLHDKEGRVDVCHDSVKKLWLKVGQQQNTQFMREVVPCRVEHYNIPLYARPVPAAPAVAVPEEWREVVNAMVEWWDDQHMTMAQGREIRNKARALLQSAPQQTTGDA